MAGLDVQDTITVDVRREDVHHVTASSECALVLVDYLTRPAVPRSEPADDVQDPHYAPAAGAIEPTSKAVDRLRTCSRASMGDMIWAATQAPPPSLRALPLTPPPGWRTRGSNV